MPFSDVELAALARLSGFYEGSNPYNAATNPGGLQNDGHRVNFVPALEDLAIVIQAASRMVNEAVAAATDSPKAVRVDSLQNFASDEMLAALTNVGLLGGKLKLTTAQQATIRTLINASAPVTLPPAAPVGSMLMHLGTEIPAGGYLPLTGGLYNRAAYPDLWTWAQTNAPLVADGQWGSYWGSFSSGDGSTTFRLPDFRGAFPRFWDNGRGVDPGRSLGIPQGSAIQDHYHGLNAPNAGVLGAGGGGYNYQNGGAGAGALSQYTTTTAYGASVAGETRPINVTVRPLIKY